MSTKLFYNKFIDDWMHALPIGNGRIGAMVYGNPKCETIEINEESLWSGRQIREEYHASPEALSEIRRLISEHRLREANALSEKNFLSSPARVRFFESFCNIYVDFLKCSECTNYRKELELNDAIVSVHWCTENGEFLSESFVSEKYDVFVYRVTCDETPFSCDITLKRAQDAYTAAISGDTLLLNGRITYFDEVDYGAGGEGISFGAVLKIVTDGKKVATHEHLSVTDATYLTVYTAFATNYDVSTFDIDEKKNIRACLNADIAALENVSYEDIKAMHIRDHSACFSKVRFELDGEDLSDVPTDERLMAVKENGSADPDLCTLYYNYGRYLLIASSQARATLPANLQGLWCHGFRPAWGSDYHTNINLQMNYWPAEVCNCSESLTPLTHFVEMLSRFGKNTAKELFDANGWVVNHTTDIFGRTGIHDRVGCGFFPMAGPWLCLNLWEHYEFTNDKSYLRQIYPILKGACVFVCDYLCEDEENRMISTPSNSPENKFYYCEPDGTKSTSMLTEGATFDFEVIYALFIRTRYACFALGEDVAFVERLSEVLRKLPPLRVSKRYGTICEWLHDYEEFEPGHRHVSHLFALHPSDQINETDSTIYEAAKRTIARRLEHGGGQTGWSRAWIINFYARLKDGEKALSSLYKLFASNTEENLFDLHPPHIFQIDGNLGATAGISELLIQSHLGTPDKRIVELLPALPPEWKNGSVTGLRARGNFTFDFSWKDGHLREVTVLSDDCNTLLLKLQKAESIPSSDASFTVDNGILSYVFKKGERITLRFYH